MRYLLTVLCIVISWGSYAHRDTVISIKDGHLSGLPKQYSPSTFDLENNILSVGKKSFPLPSCLSQYFDEQSEYDLLITSSWYHERSTLPPYLLFHVKFKSRDYSFQLLFNLETLEPISVEVKTVGISSTTTHAIQLQQYCLDDIDKNLQVN